MPADRIPSWLPLTIAGSAVAALAICFIRPALVEAENFDREADSFEAIAARHQAVASGAERARIQLETLEAVDPFGSVHNRVARADVTVSRVGSFEELMPMIAAIDEAPRSCVQRVDLVALRDGRVRLEALVDERLARVLNLSEGWAP